MKHHLARVVLTALYTGTLHITRSLVPFVNYVCMVAYLEDTVYRADAPF